MKKIILLIALLLALGIGTAQAQEKKGLVTLPNGKVVENPYVLERQPDGLIIGHRTGCLKLKFKDMPKSLQEEFKYDPVAAEAYTKKNEAADLARKRKDLERKAQDEKNLKEAAARNREDAVFRQKQNIERLKEQLKHAEEKLPKIEKRVNEDRAASVQLASGQSSRSNLTGVWGWGGEYGIRTSNRSSSDRSRVIRHASTDIRNMEREYEKTRRIVVELKLKIEQEERTLAKMMEKESD